MDIISAERKQCPCCMQTHDVQRVRMTETLTFKDVPVDFVAEFNYCDAADELYASEELLIKNDISLKNAYRKKVGLLSADDIVAIRKKYDISQSDLCRLLGWGWKTIARYETHQVQDRAHDSILRKLDKDPEWFLELLESARDDISTSTYNRCRKKGLKLFNESYDYYLSKAMKAKQLKAE